eukprot:scaffold23335_cov13-Tisochrysis_lutea.AAC.1
MALEHGGGMTIGSAAAARDSRDGTEEPPAAVLYQHVNYGGKSLELPDPDTYDMDFLTGNGFPNDVLSSVKVRPGVKVTLYRHDGTGATVSLESSAPDLRSMCT